MHVVRRERPMPWSIDLPDDHLRPLVMVAEEKHVYVDQDQTNNQIKCAGRSYGRSDQRFDFMWRSRTPGVSPLRNSIPFDSSVAWTASTCARLVLGKPVASSIRFTVAILTTA